MEKTWFRSELKERAKVGFKKNYWAAVIVSLILVIVTASGSSSTSSATREYSSQVNTYEGVLDGMSSAVETIRNITFSPWGVIAGMISVSFILFFVILAFVFQFLIGNVLEVGARSFYIENLYSNPGVGRILSGFTSGCYANIVKIMFQRGLFTFLWSLLLVIPGIVKSYEYRMIPYLLAEYPDMPSEEAFRRSKEMMYGHKWNTFVLDLSFIPWRLLSAVTFKIAGIFYVNPYVDATDAELYDTLAGFAENPNTYSGSTY